MRWLSGPTRLPYLNAHSKKCVKCNTRVMSKPMMLTTKVFETWEPYKQCEKAISLWNDEKKARLDYLALGGKLPVGG